MSSLAVVQSFGRLEGHYRTLIDASYWLFLLAVVQSSGATGGDTTECWYTHTRRKYNALEGRTVQGVTGVLDRWYGSMRELTGSSLELSMARPGVRVKDRSLACARVRGQSGQVYYLPQYST